MVACLLHLKDILEYGGINTYPHMVHSTVYTKHLGTEGEPRYVGHSLECWLGVNIRRRLAVELIKLELHMDGTLPRPWGQAWQCVYTVRCSCKICKKIFTNSKYFWLRPLSLVPPFPLPLLSCGSVPRL